MLCLLGHFLFCAVLLSLLVGSLFGLCLLNTAEVQVAQVGDVEVARRGLIGLVVLDLVGKEFD